MEDEIKFEAENQECCEEQPVDKKSNIKKELLDWAKTLLIYCVLPLLIFQTFCFMISVPTGSMDPTIPVGAQVITTRVFNKDNIDRGDIVVFYSEEMDKILVKRCIGLPGDTVTFDGTGVAYVDGEPLYEPYVSSYSNFKGEFTVPEDCYFFCGDNRGHSYDPRYFENPYIHKSEIKGKGRFVIFPFSSFGILE